MAFVFALIFFAAVTGVVKPYIRGVKRSYYAVAAAAAFILVGVTAPSASGQKTKLGTAAAAAATTDGTKVNATAPMDASEASASTTSNWQYSDVKDEMRGTSTKVAEVSSDNTVDLDFPYGEVRGQLLIRRRPEDGLNIAFEVDNGQVLCSDFEESYVSIKFDDRPVQKFRCSGTTDGSSNIAFLNDEHRVLADLEKSKRAIVEAEFFQQGRKQFAFKTAGLNWK